MKSKLSRRMCLLSAEFLLCSLMIVTAMQAPPPGCEAISVEHVSLGGVFLSQTVSLNRSEPIAYKVTLNRTGNAEFHRNGLPFKNVPNSGFDFLGQTDAVEFSKLCQSATDPRLETPGLSNGPLPNRIVSDGAEITVKITSDQATKTIVARSPYEPTELHTFQLAIIALAERIVWKEKSQKP